MKKSLGLASLLLAGSLYGASEDAGKWYLGVGTFNGSGTHSVTRTNGYSDYDLSVDVSSTPVSIGFINENNNRFELSLFSMDADFSTGEKETISGYDINANITLDSMQSGNLLPYINVGFGLYNWDNSGSDFVGGKDLKGVGFNLDLGLFYSIQKNIELEVAYQTKNVSWQEIQYTNYNATLSDSINGLYLGLNLKF